jgi:hypothetical protein
MAIGRGSLAIASSNFLYANMRCHDTDKPSTEGTKEVLAWKAGKLGSNATWAAGIVEKSFVNAEKPPV